MTADAAPDFTAACPAPRPPGNTVLLGHGGGGRLTGRLLETLIRPAFDNPLLDQRHDSAVFDSPGARLAFTTDSFVVQPLFFPGGNIGRLAVHGTVNDLAMAGARPVYLSCSLIIEEGFGLDDLGRILAAMRAAADEAGARLVTGDTKVVERGKGDGLFVNTAGIGVVEAAAPIGPAEARAGDVVILNGDVGRHGMAIMAQREGLAFESAIESDSADLSGLVLDLIRAGLPLHVLRDCTRGGVAAALIEIADTAHLDIHVREAAVPVDAAVQGACEILGLDPLQVANEGRFICLAPAAAADAILARMRAHPLGAAAVVIGAVRAPARAGAGRVTLESVIGATRLLDLFSGEQLPRIC